MDLSRTTQTATARKLKHFLSTSTLSAVVMLFGSASLSQAAIIQFTGGATPNNVSVSAGPTVSAQDSVGVMNGPFGTLNVSGAPLGNGAYNNLSVNFAYSPDILTVTGSIPALNGNLAASSTLLTINFSVAGLTTDNTSGTFILNFPTNVTSIVVSPTLLSDLGLSAAGISLAGLTDTATPLGFTFQGQLLYIQSSSTLTLASSAAAAPEPGFQLMTILALVFMVFVTRGKFVKAR